MLFLLKHQVLIIQSSG